MSDQFYSLAVCFWLAITIKDRKINRLEKKRWTWIFLDMFLNAAFVYAIVLTVRWLG